MPHADWDVENMHETHCFISPVLVQWLNIDCLFTWYERMFH